LLKTRSKLFAIKDYKIEISIIMEVVGIPEQKNENCVEITENIAAKLGVTL